MYVELHAHSYYSLLDGVASPEALVEQAARFGMPAIAVTDHDALYGAPRFAKAAEQASVKPIFGAELTLSHEDGHLMLLAETNEGYANLCHLITLARRDQEKGFAALPWRLLAEHSNGLIALSGCRRGGIGGALQQREGDKAFHLAQRYAAIFGHGSFYLELQRHRDRSDRRVNAGLVSLAHRLRLPLVATGNTHYLTRDEAPLHDILTCIRQRLPLEQAGAVLRPNHEYYFRSPPEMAALFADHPEALRATLAISERCMAELPYGPQALPAVAFPEGQTPIAYLRQLCKTGLARKPIPAYQRQRYAETLERELATIAEQNLPDAFLIVHDVMRQARSVGIVCQARGSGVNSIVCYALDISPIDPLSCGLVFERFMSPERQAPVDIDVDFASDRREEVIQYIYQKYGHDHVAMACVVSTFGAKQALRDVGKVLGFSGAVLDRVSAAADTHSAVGLPDSEGLRSAFGPQLDSRRWQELVTYAAALDSFPRHLGIHSGGMIISAALLHRCIPVEPATMEDRTVVQWDKDALATAGWMKFDVLSLRQMAAINDACDVIVTLTGQRPDLNVLRFDDQKVYEMIRQGKTIGVFQLESRAQASLIPRFKPRCFADLTVQIALIRPGPVQANMVHPYLRRREGAERVAYLHPRLEAALRDTLGIILFQEDVLKVAQNLAGFTPGEGELLRRALGHKRAEAEIESFRERFVTGAQAQGVAPMIAKQVFAQLKAFGGYSFSKAHAAAFAVLSYWSAWLRCYHPIAFFAGLLHHQPMGFYPAHVVVSDAQRVGVKFLPVDVRHSEATATVENNAIRLGLDYVHGFGAEHIEAVLAERARAPYHSLADLIKRTSLDRPHLEALVLAGGLDYLGERRQVLWDLAEAFRLVIRPPELPLQIPGELVTLSPMDEPTRLQSAFASTGVSVVGHLSELRRDAFTKAGARPIRELSQLRYGQMVKIGGVVVSQQRPGTAKGFAFLAVEDPDGMVNVVVPPIVQQECREAMHRAFVVVEGAVQFDHGAINVVARKVVAV